ncbi:MAG TPA: NADH:ubiquinone oxidoreductase, partial [bacterium]|nr:NADH:ubiquinone oxidoreductase [bacterium]
RSLVGELEWIHSHLLWLSLDGHFIGYDTVWMWAWKYREAVLEMMEIISGNRNHYGMMRVGGVGQDIKPGDIPELLDRLDMIDKKMEMIAKVANDDPVLKARLKGVGVLSHQEAIDYCAVGPTSRASGVPWDVRRDDPHDAYGMLDFDVITRPNGDVYDKLVVRVLEIIESSKICRQCLDQLAQVQGPILNDVKEISPGEGIGRYEAPRGEVFHYIRSDGSNRPVRHKVRAPSYVNIPTYEASCKGISVSDALITLASVDPCYCCTERSLKVHSDQDEKPDLLALSKQKTERIRREYNAN